MALSNRLDENHKRVYALLGDGECQEGQVWEASMAAAHYHLDNLCLIIDHNRLQIDGEVAVVMNVESLEKKFEGFNFHVVTIDGHDFTQDVYKRQHQKYLCWIKSMRHSSSWTS